MIDNPLIKPSPPKVIALKPSQNKKGQKNLGYPTKKQSFYKEKDCFFVGYPKFFGPSYIDLALVTISEDVLP